MKEGPGLPYLGCLRRLGPTRKEIKAKEQPRPGGKASGHGNTKQEEILRVGQGKSEGETSPTLEAEQGAANQSGAIHFS